MKEVEFLKIEGARAHNLKNVSLIIPRDQLVVFTGLSGSGKSSLAFDTIYAEGQRRYMETFSAYARQFLGNLERPDVDRIEGLSPVIAIEQKTTNKNPRSTVGTITEVYDFLRLLYARVADAYSYNTGKKMVQYTDKQIIEQIINDFADQKLMLLAPMVKGRKGHYRELFEQLRKQGYSKVRIDGEVEEISFGMKLDRYKVHDIELVVDRIKINEDIETRLSKSIEQAMTITKGLVMVINIDTNEVRHYSRNLMCVDTGIAYDNPEPNSFSFNSPYGACHKCNGLGIITEVDTEKIMPDKNQSIRSGGILPLGAYKKNWIFQQLEAISHKMGFDLDTPLKDIPDEGMDVIFYGSQDTIEIKNEYLGITNTYKLNFEGIINFVMNQSEEDSSQSIKKWVEKFTNHITCPVCHGARLKKESLHFKINDKTISELAEMDLVTLSEWIDLIEDQLDARKKQVAHEILREIKTRIGFLLNIGIDYLSLNRQAKSLSGGESQRIRLATQIGSQLTGVLYILDEPSIGLHQRDNKRLIQSLRSLRDIGNSVIVVEHDEEMIRSADYIVDIGPEAGKHGGEIVARGSINDILQSNSLTAQYLNGSKKISIPKKLRKGNGQFILLKGAKGHNLKEVDLEIPLGTFICITGVSGSGKSSLINETLYPILSKYFYQSEKEPLPYHSIEGINHIDKVIEIDQSPIGRTPRSNPATYTGVFTDIRNLFAVIPESKIRGYKSGRFSFNVKGGRCETCKGAGLKLIEMNFLPDVYVNCDECFGKRYNRETLEVRFKGKSINDVLELTINQAVVFFENHPHILNRIKTLQDVGLGYITLGQASTTLSGGEAQRVKLATELSKKDTGKTLYILDEPTTGLHFEDVAVLLRVLNRLADKGNTIIVIEHNLDVIKMADYLIDIGPDGGKEGGRIINKGTPQEVIKAGLGYTAEFLKEIYHS
jgi:excinuclease ABC subunit A